MSPIKVNRKKYQEIRKMDHAQLQKYIYDVFSFGYESGVKAACDRNEVPELIGLEDELCTIRGVGSARARFICDKVKEFLERKAGNDEASAEISGE